MFSRKHRLSKKAFSTVFTQGKRFFAGFVLIYTLKTPSKEEYAVVVPKKVAKRAVDRNRIKRQVTGILEDLLKGHSTNTSVVVMVKKELLDAKRAEILADLQSVLKKATLL